MKKNILIVDDSESVRELIMLTLESGGYNVEPAVDGADAMSFLNRSNIDLVITDLNMPKMDGIQLTREIKKADGFKNVPVILLTTELPNAKKEEARAAGAIGWIVKPFPQQKLLDIVNRLLKNTN